MARSAQVQQAPTKRSIAAGHFNLQQQPGIIFRRLANTSHTLFHRLSGQDEITGPQLTVLVTLIQNGPMIQSGMSKSVYMDKNTLAEMLRRMNERGLVKRETLATDKRAVKVSITEKGERMAAALIDPALAVGDALLNPLPAEYRMLFLKCLTILSAAVESDNLK